MPVKRAFDIRATMRVISVGTLDTSVFPEIDF